MILAYSTFLTNFMYHSSLVLLEMVGEMWCCEDVTPILKFDSVLNYTN